MDKLLLEEYKSLIKGIKYEATILAQTAAFIYRKIDDISWAGFYIVGEECLYLSSYQGEIACEALPFDKGVCAKSYRDDKTIIVNNVHEFSSHIACDALTNSELVIPIHKNNKIYGVLDLDSYKLNRFDEDIVNFFNELSIELEKALREIK